MDIPSPSKNRHWVPRTLQHLSKDSHKSHRPGPGKCIQYPLIILERLFTYFKRFYEGVDNGDWKAESDCSDDDIESCLVKE